MHEAPFKQPHLQITYLSYEQLRRQWTTTPLATTTTLPSVQTMSNESKTSESRTRRPTSYSPPSRLNGEDIFKAGGPERLCRDNERRARASEQQKIEDKTRNIKKPSAGSVEMHRSHNRKSNKAAFEGKKAYEQSMVLINSVLYADAEALQATKEELERSIRTGNQTLDLMKKAQETRSGTSS